MAFKARSQSATETLCLSPKGSRTQWLKNHSTGNKSKQKGGGGRQPVHMVTVNNVPAQLPGTSLPKVG